MTFKRYAVVGSDSAYAPTNRSGKAKNALLVGILFALGAVSSARAELIINVYEEGGFTIVSAGNGVVGGAGSLAVPVTNPSYTDLVAGIWTLDGPSSNNTIRSSLTNVQVYSGGVAAILGGAPPIVGTPNVTPWLSTGDGFGYFQYGTGQGGVYASDFSSIQGEMRISSATASLASLGFVPQTLFIRDAGNTAIILDSIVFRSGAPTAAPAVVPEPATAFGLLGLLTAAFFRRRRRAVRG